MLDTFPYCLICLDSCRAPDEAGTGQQRWAYSRSTAEHKDASEVEWKDNNGVCVDDREGGVGVLRRQPGVECDRSLYRKPEDTAAPFTRKGLRR